MKTSPSNTIEVESLIHALARVGQNSIKSYDFKIIESISNQIYYNQEGMTEKQANLCLKILKKNINILNTTFLTDVLPFINSPVYKYPLRVVNNHYKISLIEENSNYQKIKLEFPFNELIVKQIKSQKDKIYNYQWDPTEKSWYLSMETASLQLCYHFVQQYNFEYDPAFEIYFDQIRDITNNLENIVPMVDYIDGKYKIKNAFRGIPEFASDNLIDSLFTARKYGVYTWSDTVEDHLNKLSTCSLTVNFLKHNDHKEFVVDSSSFSKKSIENLIKHLLPGIFFIPAGSELATLQNSLDLLQSAGIDNSEITTLFRLPNETNSTFNKFIKENGLNSPLSRNTKAVFISTKIPKTIFQTDLKFNTAIMYNRYYAHYTTKDFLRNFQNILEIVDKKAEENRKRQEDWLIDG